MAIEIIVGAAGASLTLLDLVLRAKGSLIAPKKDPFINYDTSYLLGVYSEETPISHFIPYSELISMYPEGKKIEIKINNRKFMLRPPNQEWSKVSDLGFSQLIESQRVRDNEGAIRLHEVLESGDNISFSLQKASYFDQCKSNLILDWSSQDDDGISLRSLQRGIYGGLLPNLNDKTMANTVGIAALIYYREEDEYVPYMVKRVKKVGVFPGGIHCTSSGVAKWPSDSADTSFENFFTKHMYSELEEEVGLTKNDISELIPMAVCREFARGGKPQVFYAGFTELSKSELIEKRIKAQATIAEMKLWPEIEQQRWYHSEIVLGTDELMGSISKYKVTLEGVASLHYGIKYLQQHRI
ncbi:hypothetical protein QPB21_003775 [Vibrio alginolyticus]|jgi:hypothetical protein|uniref:hypothetical protein n=1 Tax=Vibrio TaxID=662 RepID=UPI0006CA6E5F|nr:MULTISPECIES: hypothetical protein [Vibrio]QIR88735.1 hypothetical protein FQ332_08525 [Vibrio diabolicus]EGQ9098385.1 hypothetical protein [Vibrio alginolyticus]EGR0269097.1 hypothetical protein [Vibrio alginolyticus]EGR0722237.1 hypothetical protein [Vibrio alginolyticus]EGR2558261.1 hypothetical protein [Vibrio alginolyticus]